MARYFSGSTVVQVEREGYQEPMRIPKAGQAVVEKAVRLAVESGTLWLLSGPASILGELIPAGVLNAAAKLCPAPDPIAPAEILPANLPGAWQDGVASALAVATALSVKAGKTLPWKTVRDVITAALQARFLVLDQGSGAWPCDFPAAQFVKLRVPTGPPAGGSGRGRAGPEVPALKVLVASAELEPSEIQELGDVIPDLLKLKAKANAPFRFHVRIEMGDGKTLPSPEAAKEANKILKKVKDALQLGGAE